MYRSIGAQKAHTDMSKICWRVESNNVEHGCYDTYGGYYSMGDPRQVQYLSLPSPCKNAAIMVRTRLL